jgi:hypothetical protein
LSIDPVVTDTDTGSSFNRYAYAANNPYRYIDPDGRDPEFINNFKNGFVQGVSDASHSQGYPDVTNGTADRSSAGYLLGLGIGQGLVNSGHGGRMPGGPSAVANTKVGTATAIGAAGGRNANKVAPVSGADGAHSVVKRDANGNVTNTATYAPNPQNPSGFDEVKRVDVTGKSHTNPDGTNVPTPHVHEAGQKGVRPATPEDLPGK